MRVVHVITSLDTGGAEIMLSKLLAELPTGEFDNTVICLKQAGPVSQRIADLDIPIFYLGMRRNGLSLIPWLRLFRLASRLQPDLIQAWMYHANLVGLLLHALSRKRPPLLWNIRHSLPDIRLEPLKTRLLLRIGALCSALPQTVIYNSEAAMHQHRAVGYRNREDRVIPNGFDLERFRPNREQRARTRTELGVTADQRLVGLIARHHPFKGHDVFLQAAALIAQDHRKVMFLCAGRGVDQHNPKLGKSLARLGLENRVMLLGEWREAEALMNALDILVVASGWGEGFPNVLGEAMACGVPCVTTDVGDSAKVVGETGQIVPPGDPQALADGIKTLLKLPEDQYLHLTKHSRERIKDQFSITSVANQYADLYRSKF